jgi:hypothetical protein
MSTHDLTLNAFVTNPRTARARRVSPLTNEVTSQIISQPPASAAPLMAPDIPVAIDPGPVLGVARDDLTDDAVAEAAQLPVQVVDRAAADPTIRIGDRVRALHRTPRHVVLVFSGHRVTLFDGVGGRLVPATSAGFPMDLLAHGGAARDDGSLQPALAAVDLALGSYLRLHPAPVILAGPQKLVSAFASLSQHMARLAGTVYGGFDHAHTAELARRTRPVLNRYLDSHQHAALARLKDRATDQQVASGITSVWHAARTQKPEMLLVEDSYRYRAQLSADGDAVTPADDVTAPDVTAPEVIDDLVDELIQTVLTRGGSIVLAQDGALPAHDRIALTLG